MSRKVHIDADVLNYEVAFAAQKTQYHLHQGKKKTTFKDAEAAKKHCEDNDLDYRALRTAAAQPDKPAAYIDSTLEVLPESVCKPILLEKLGRILTTCGTREYVMHLSGPVNFRDQVGVTKPYKGNRDQPKPQHYQHVKRLLLADDNINLSEGNEADDEISIAMWRAKGNDICATIDKDLNMVPGYHFDWNKGLRYKVDPALGMWFFCAQMLTGDATDNIPGIPGMGEKKVESLLMPYRNQNGVDVHSSWATVLNEYNKGPFKLAKGPDTKNTGLPAKFIVEQMQLLWMQREVGERIDPKKLEVYL